MNIRSIYISNLLIFSLLSLFLLSCNKDLIFPERFEENFCEDYVDSLSYESKVINTGRYMDDGFLDLGDRLTVVGRDKIFTIDKKTGDIDFHYEKSFGVNGFKYNEYDTILYIEKGLYRFFPSSGQMEFLTDVPSTIRDFRLNGDKGIFYALQSYIYYEYDTKTHFYLSPVHDLSRDNNTYDDFFTYQKDGEDYAFIIYDVSSSNKPNYGYRLHLPSGDVTDTLERLNIQSISRVINDSIIRARSGKYHVYYNHITRKNTKRWNANIASFYYRAYAMNNDYFAVSVKNHEDPYLDITFWDEKDSDVRIPFLKEVGEYPSELYAGKESIFTSGYYKHPRLIRRYSLDGCRKSDLYIHRKGLNLHYADENIYVMDSIFYLIQH